MQSVSSRNWTRIAVFISYDDNDYTTGTSNTLDKAMNLLILSSYGLYGTIIFLLQEKFWH